MFTTVFFEFAINYNLQNKPQIPQIRMTPMVTIPISPLVCSVLTTLTLIVTFYAGRYVGKSVMVRQF